MIGIDTRVSSAFEATQARDLKEWTGSDLDPRIFYTCFSMVRCLW